jgi:hypothetical protein
MRTAFEVYFSNDPVPPILLQLCHSQSADTKEAIRSNSRICIRCSWTGCSAHDWEKKFQGGFGNTYGNTFSSRKLIIKAKYKALMIKILFLRILIIKTKYQAIIIKIGFEAATIGSGFNAPIIGAGFGALIIGAGFWCTSF